MGKGKGSFDHWGTLAPAGKMLFEISSPGIRVEIAKEALVAAGKAIPGPVQFVDKARLTEPAVVGLSRTPIFHAGIKVDGPIDTKKRMVKTGPVVISPQIGYEKLAKARKGLVRR
jgi:Ribosomal protein L16p/L10e